MGTEERLAWGIYLPAYLYLATYLPTTQPTNQPKGTSRYSTYLTSFSPVACMVA